MSRNDAIGSRRRVVLPLAVAASLLTFGASGAAPSGPATRCVVGVDAPTDAATMVPGEINHPATEILSAQLGFDEKTMEVGLQILDLTQALPERTSYLEYVVTLLIGSGQDAVWYWVFATIQPGLDVEFSFRGDDYTQLKAARGVFDRRSGLVRIFVPRNEIRAAADGVKIAGIDTYSRLVRMESWAYYHQDDTMSLSEAQGFSFKIGSPCAAQSLISCPLLVDNSGDAGPLVRADGSEVPENREELDLLAAGADASDRTLRLSARIADPAAPIPEGFDTIGWTVSWGYRGTRWAAQVSRTEDALRFSYAAASEDEEEIAGPIIGGRSTTGTFDARTGEVTVNVPRSAVGSPPDGARLAGVGATSWTRLSGNTVSPWRVVDQTNTRSYRTGLACGV